MACLAVSLAAQQSDEAKNWKRWEFLLGNWVGEGGGESGQGSGGFSFALDLQGKILVRKNRADYPATKERPAYSHADLMVVYPEAGTKRERAIYFDNEGHVIHYGIEFSRDGRTVVFLSDVSASAPRYRLTYAEKSAGAVTIKFEIAPPGKPDAFSKYIEAAARRESR